MNSHKNARLTVHSRLVIVRRVTGEGLRPIEVAQAMGVSVRTVYKWLNRYLLEGEAGLENRSSRPRQSPAATPEAATQKVVELRRHRMTYRQIAKQIGISTSTVGRRLQRAGLNRLSALEPARPDNRYEHDAPGELLHLDIKKLGRFARPGHRVTGTRTNCRNDGAGWEYVHVAIDDHSRIAFGSIHPDETGKSACEALLKAVRYYRGLGIRFKQLLTDNGAAYRSRRFRRLCRRLRLVHRRTRPYTPRTNGKAERFIQTALREWAYARSYESSAQRARHLLPWLHQYNWHRPHASLAYQPPISRSGLSVNNLLSSHT